MEKVSIGRYVYNKDNEEYIVYLIPEDDDIMNFYIQEKNSGLISQTVGVHKKDIDKLDYSIEELINNNIDNWIDICKDQLEILESS